MINKEYFEARVDEINDNPNQTFSEELDLYLEFIFHVASNDYDSLSEVALIILKIQSLKLKKGRIK